MQESNVEEFYVLNLGTNGNVEFLERVWEPGSEGESLHEANYSTTRSPQNALRLRVISQTRAMIFNNGDSVLLPKYFNRVVTKDGVVKFNTLKELLRYSDVMVQHIKLETCVSYIGIVDTVDEVPFIEEIDDIVMMIEDEE